MGSRSDCRSRPIAETCRMNLDLRVCLRFLAALLEVTVFVNRLSKPKLVHAVTGDISLPLVSPPPRHRWRPMTHGYCNRAGGG